MVRPERSAHDWVERVLESDGRGILRLLWRMLGREADVLDAYQDCFCKLSGYKNGSDLNSARAFAYRTASNIAIEMVRVRKRRLNHWDKIARGRGGTVDVDPLAEKGDVEHEQLREAIAQLPHHLRGVVVLRDLSRLSYEEVGHILNIEPATARVYRRHAVVKLAELLQQGGCHEQP